MVGGVPLPVLKSCTARVSRQVSDGGGADMGSVELVKKFKRPDPAQVCSTECCPRWNSSSVKEEESF